LHIGVRRIGVLRGETFVFDNEDETPVLIDYSIFGIYSNDRNAVEQDVCDSPPAKKLLEE